jgi:ribonuclease HII
LKLDKKLPPISFAEEKLGESQGYSLIAGVDEVGRGCLAGPVVAAAVIMPQRRRISWLKKVKDSKMLSPEQRESLFPLITGAAVSTGVGVVSSEVIDTSGMTRAVQIAMRNAVEQLKPAAQYVLIDYFTIPDIPVPQKGVIEGDSVCVSIACASIVAKVTRDRIMIEMDKTFPGYGLARHKGYGTGEHMACLKKLGPCPIHRRSFAPVRAVIERQIELDLVYSNVEEDET